jgi:hypothetical protein
MSVIYYEYIEIISYVFVQEEIYSLYNHISESRVQMNGMSKAVLY